MVRSLEAEWVDELPADDPGAIKTRRDLRRINALMGHIGILARALATVTRGNRARNGSPVDSLNQTARPDCPDRLEVPVPLTPALSHGAREKLCCDLEAANNRQVNSAEDSIDRTLRIVEIGAGDGQLLLRVARRLANRWTQVEATLVDLQDLLRGETKAAFAALGWRVRVVKGDVLKWISDLASENTDLIVANLFLHHFSDAQLSELFSIAAKKADGFIALEPRRAGWPLFCARCLALIGFNSVTCHDAPISVRAGFTGSELTRLWPQDGNWELTERRAGLFSHLFIARRKD